MSRHKQLATELWRGAGAAAPAKPEAGYANQDIKCGLWLLREIRRD